MSIPRIIPFSFLCVFFPSLLFADLSEVERIKDRLRADIAEHIHIGRADAERHLASIEPDGSWAQIIYDYRKGDPDLGKSIFAGRLP